MKIISFESVMKLFVLLFITFFIVAALSSCESNSGKAARAKTEKVVIVDDYATTNMLVYTGNHKYKVKRIDYGVMDYYITPNFYNTGDTIYAKFQ